jgi:hypothetical protein
MTDVLDRDPIDPPATALLGLFEGPLRAVRFPDVDAEVLKALADAVRSSARDVAAARDALVAAQTALRAAEQALVADELALRERCTRALAYARVYATTADPSIRDAVATLDLPPAAPPGAPPFAAAPPRRRGRPRKVVATSGEARSETTLFMPQANDVEVAATAAE